MTRRAPITFYPDQSVEDFLNSKSAGDRSKLINEIITEYANMINKIADLEGKSNALELSQKEVLALKRQVRELENKQVDRKPAPVVKNTGMINLS